MSFKRVHLIYPHGPGINCPETIGRHLALGLGKHWPVTLHPWTAAGRLKADPEAILIGHPHPSPLSLFRRSAAVPGWGKVAMLCPFNADLRQVAWLEPVLAKVDLYLAITGPYWWKALAASPMAHWQPRMQPLDLAVDRADFPRVKKSFAPVGRRRFLFIGHSGWPKNTDYLSELALSLPGWDFAWAGSGPAIPGVRSLGRLDFSTREAQRAIAGFDFMITLGTADANPATLLEAMAWGLVPVCSPQSGYDNETGIVNVPLEDRAAALAVLQRLQAMPGAGLRRLVAANDRRLRTHFQWDRFNADVIRALRKTDRPALGPVTAATKAALAWQRWRGPNRPLRWRWLGLAARDAMRAR